MENNHPQKASSFQNAAEPIGWAGLVVLLAFQVTANWQWSLMMDDVAYTSYMPRISHLLSAFQNEVVNYWHMGRFYPVKYLANLLKFRYLPLQPALFHWFNLGVLVLTIGLTSLAVSQLSPSPNSKKEFPWFLCMASLAIAQRPLLDVIALNTIAEGWVILFLGLGLLFYRRSAVLSRLAFLLCALSKEPAVMVFVASVVAEFYAAFAGIRQRRTAVFRAVLDMTLFIVLILIIRQAKNSGGYLEGYQIISLANLKPFLIGMIKCGIGLAPLAILIGSKFSKKSGTGLTKALLPEELLMILFGLAYLLLAIPRGTAGYLLIPVSYSFFVAGMIRLRSIPDIFPVQVVTWAVVLLAVTMGSSLWRYTRYVNAINESSVALRLLALSPSPRVVFVNGMEAADAVSQIARDNGTPVRGVLLTTSDELRHLAATGSPETVIFELSGYFGTLSDDILTAARPAAGWRAEIHERFYRIYFR